MSSERQTLSFAESREEPSLTNGETELLNEAACERLELVEHHCHEQLVTCFISIANS